MMIKVNMIWNEKLISEVVFVYVPPAHEFDEIDILFAICVRK